MSTETIIFIGVAVYLAMMLVIGAYASKKANTATNFIVAGRRMPIWICGATIMATWFGGGTMMGGAGASYQGGLFAVIADPFGGALASMAIGFLTWLLAILYAPEFPGDLLGLLTGLLTMLIITPLTQKTDPPKRLLNSDGEEVELKDRLGTLPLFRRAV